MAEFRVSRSQWVPLLWLLGSSAALAWYLYGCSLMWPANKHWQEEARSRSYDQVAYVNMAWTMAEDGAGDPSTLYRSRMPLYPYLLHFLYDPIGDEIAQFTVYKRFNITLSCLALIGLGVVATRKLGAALGFTLTVITASTFFIFKAVLVQPEISFYLLYLCLLLLMMRVLAQPKKWQMFGLGILAGIVYFLKGSCLPLMLLFLVILCGKTVGSLWRTRRTPGVSSRSRWAPVLLPLIFLASFLSVTGLYLYRSYLYYGTFIYEPNTTYYFWADSADEMEAMKDLDISQRKPGLDQHNVTNPDLQRYLAEKWLPDPVRRAALLRLVEEQGKVILEGEWDILPTARNWRRNHTWQDAKDRLWNGFFNQNTGLFYHNATHRNGYFWYVSAFGIAAVVGVLLMLWLKRAELFAQWKQHALPWFFVSSSILGNFVLYAWWAQISSSNRFFLTQFLPLMVSLGIVIRWSFRQLTWEALKCPLAKRFRFLKIERPLWALFLLLLWIPLVSDVLRLGRLDQPYYKKRPSKTAAEVLLVQ